MRHAEAAQANKAWVLGFGQGDKDTTIRSLGSHPPVEYFSWGQRDLRLCHCVLICAFKMSKMQ